MEVNGYLEHGYRVLSHPDGKQTPEILEHAEHVELPGLKKNRAIDLKLEGNKEASFIACCSPDNATLCTRRCRSCSSASPHQGRPIRR
jgi:hypothetical protein